MVFAGRVPDPPDGMTWPEVADWYLELREGCTLVTETLCRSIPALAAVRDGLEVYEHKLTTADAVAFPDGTIVTTSELARRRGMGSKPFAALAALEGWEDLFWGDDRKDGR